jgi:hypothetical protein
MTFSFICPNCKRNLSSNVSFPSQLLVHCVEHVTFIGFFKKLLVLVLLHSFFILFLIHNSVGLKGYHAWRGFLVLK